MLMYLRGKLSSHIVKTENSGRYSFYNHTISKPKGIPQCAKHTNSNSVTYKIIIHTIFTSFVATVLLNIIVFCYNGFATQPMYIAMIPLGAFTLLLYEYVSYRLYISAMILSSKLSSISGYSSKT